MIEKIRPSFKNIAHNQPQNVFGDFKYYPLQMQPDAFINSQKTSKNKKLLIAGLFVLAALGIAAIAFRKNIKRSHVEKVFKEQMSRFPSDIEYRKAIVADMGLPAGDYHKLRPVIGVQELEDFVQKSQGNEVWYVPGTKTYKGNEAIFSGKENAQNFKFRANLHLHTHHSDGTITVPQLFEEAVGYADKLAKKTKQPFYIAITDHDSVEGCKEAVNLILSDPWKYRNLRVALGVEHSLLHANTALLNEPAYIHVLSYGINPFGKDIGSFLTPRVQKNRENITAVIENANNQFRSVLDKNKFSYDFDEAAKMAPLLKSSPRVTDLCMKDYFQFKLIHAETVGNNRALQEFFARHYFDPEDFDFTSAIRKIPENPDYSKGQKYWEHYHDALKKHIMDTVREKAPAIDEKELTRCFVDISQDTKDALAKFESGCLDPTSSLFVKKVGWPDYKSGIEQLSSFEHGVMGMAHPGVLFPANCTKSEKDMPELYKELYDIFTEKGGDKAKFAEGYYQVYFKNMDFDIIKELDDLGSTYNLLKTGGLDTHSASVFESK